VKASLLIRQRVTSILFLCTIAIYSAGAAEPGSVVRHSPLQPHSAEVVHIVATLPAQTQKAELEVQVVEPGHYIERKDPAFATNWVSIPMTRSPSQFSADIPSGIQKHRSLVRYRIRMQDATGRWIHFPAATNSVPNLAYFVYDGVPSWRGAIEPGSADPARARSVEFSPAALQRLPVYHLISKKASVEASTWGEEYRGKDYKWSGTIVYKGKVYDHIHYRSRGGTWRYAMGKNMWKFEFNKGHDLEAEDNFGRAYSVPWSKLNLGACIQQGQYGHRGEQGMFEAIGFKLFNLAGSEASHTHWVHFRIIDEEKESDPGNQYAGDFWGLYLAVEEMGSRFLKEHHLPEGNLFKMEGGTGELKATGGGAVTNKSDLNAFMNGYQGVQQSDAWWRSHLDLPRYYSYRSVIEAIHHYDIGEGKNYFYFLDPKSGRWSVHPWDLDLTWANGMYGSGEEPFHSRVLPRPAFRFEYQNRLRELRDLLLNTDQVPALIDEFARILTGGQEEPASILAADRARWDYHPAMARSGNAGAGQFYRASPTHDFAGMVQLMNIYVRKRSTFIDRILLNDPDIPAAPVVTRKAKDLEFGLSDYRGKNPFAALQWRIAEVKIATKSSETNRYEIAPIWQSSEQLKFDSSFSFPRLELATGTYRVRARVKDNTGRWSHWSAPLEIKGAL
jgi:hypothetical protein